MSEESETLEHLEEARIREMIRWVFEWVFHRVNKDYDPAAGHGQAVVGLLAFTYAVDLFNRLSAAGRYRLPDGASDDRGLDLLQEGIPAEAFEAMLKLDRSSIVRSDFAGSPGWAVGDIRWILQSMPYGDVDKINWADKSETKQRAGRQPYDYGNPGLFALEEYGLGAELTDNFTGITFVLAHAFNGETGAYEVYFGHSRAADQPGSGPWHWRRLVAAGGFGPTHSPDEDGRVKLPGTPPAPVAPDANVRMRTSKSATGTDE
jgi:hypothetical protein